MARYSLFTPELMDRWLKEGRGQGEGFNYKPWLRVQSFPSSGVVYRIKGWKHGRIHHLFSNLERSCFLQYQRPLSVIEIREQYPLLPIEETIEIAREMDVRHPTDPRTKYPIVMTTDFLLFVEDRLTNSCHPISVKYLKDAKKLRTVEKLEIERRYWAATPRNCKLKIFTELHVVEAICRNMLWVHPFYWPADLYPLTEQHVNKIASVLTYLILNEEYSLGVVAQKTDRILRLETGTGLVVARHLIANRYWEVDIHSLIRTNQRLILLATPNGALYSKRGFFA